MLNTEVKKNSIGIDAGKRNLEVCKLMATNRKVWKKFNTDINGLNELIKFIDKGDIIGLEAGNLAFRIAKFLLVNGFNDTYVLNPGDLANIYNSLRKTDKEDALKLARLMARIPVEELPVVPVPSDKIEHARYILKEQEFWTKQAALFKNKLHSIFVHSGITNIKKKDLANIKNRDDALKLLAEGHLQEAERINNYLKQFEETLKELNKSIGKILSENVDYTTIAMSIPGVGPVTTLAMYAYLEDCKRFSSGKQVGYYAGLVPRVDISGDTVKYGHITKRGATQLRRTTIQAAWACVRSKNGGCLTDFYCRLSARIGKKKAIVATARKMLEIFYAMIRSGQKFNGVPEIVIQKKLKLYKIAS